MGIQPYNFCHRNRLGHASPVTHLRLVHLSDLHLGYRQYQRLTARGINQREADVAESFKQAVSKIIEVTPDLVVIGGDIFHQVRPSNAAIVHAFLQFTRLRQNLPKHTEIVMVAGNHDTPRSTETGSILRLFKELGVHVVDAEPQALDFPALDLSVLAVAKNQHPRPKLEPAGNRQWNVLLMHESVEGEYDNRAASPEMLAQSMKREDLNEARWDYIALGHYHVYRALGKNQYYSGSIDYTSSDTWGDRAEERDAKIKNKRIIEHDLSSGEHKAHWLKPTREFLDLEPISARGLTTEEVNDAIAARVNAVRGGIDDKIVRLVVRDLQRHVARQLDHRQIREFRRRALHFQLDTRRPDSIVRQSGQGGAGRRSTLEELVRDKLRERDLPIDVNRDDLVDLGVHYLKEASDRESVAVFSPAAIDG